MEQTTEIQELSLEKVIDSKLVQNNVTETVLAALKEKYGGMKLAALDDKESYLELKAAAKDCAKLRTLAVKICKEGREDALKTQKLWIAKEKEVVGKVADVEDALDAEIAKFDAEVERKATEEKNRQEEAYINRQAQLTKLGATYSDGSFVLGDASFEAILVKESSQEVWDEAVVPKFQAEYEKIESVRVEGERAKAEQEQKMREDQEKLRQEQEQFRLQQEEFARKQQEAERLENEKRLAEEEAKRQANSKLQNDRLNKLLPLNPYGESVDMSNLWTLTEDKFNKIVSSKSAAFESFKIEQERLAEEKKQAEIQDAIEQEKKRQEEERVLAEQKAREEEEKRKADLEAANDKTKWEDFIKNVQKLETFEMRSGQYRKKMNLATDLINQIIGL